MREAAVKAAQPLIDKPLELPQGPAEWIFYYACPDDGSTLQPLNLKEHQCPICKKIYTDERTVAAYRSYLHGAVERAAQTLGWAYIW